jgi:hypothetical protein
MGADEAELEDVLRIEKRRLLELRKQAAQMGRNTPAEIRMEIEDLTRRTSRGVEVVEAVVSGELPPSVLDALRAYGVPASIAAAVQNFEARLYDWRREFLEFRDQQSRLRETEHTDRETRQLETDRQREQVNTRLIRIELYVQVVGGLIVISVLVIAIVVALSRLGFI